MKLIITLFILSIHTFSFSQWTKISNYAGGATDGAPAFVINNIAYVGGGISSKQFFSYNAVTDTWTNLEDIPGDVNRAWAFGFNINDKVYICGGDHTGSFDLTDDFREYNPSTNKWTKKASYGGGKIDGAFSCSYNGKGYVFGGFNGEYAVNEVWEYNPVTDVWKQKTNYPGGQSIFPSGFIIGDKIYVGLGSASGMAGKKTFYEYNPATDTWKQKADFAGTARQAAVGFSLNNKGYIGGGEANYNSSFNDFYEYNPKTDKWILIKELKFPVNGATAWSTLFIIGNDIFMGLGASFKDKSLNYSSNFFKLNNLK